MIVQCEPFDPFASPQLGSILARASRNVQMAREVLRHLVHLFLGSYFVPSQGSYFLQDVNQILGFSSKKIVQKQVSAQFF